MHGNEIYVSLSQALRLGYQYEPSTSSGEFVMGVDGRPVYVIMDGHAPQGSSPRSKNIGDGRGWVKCHEQEQWLCSYCDTQVADEMIQTNAGEDKHARCPACRQMQQGIGEARKPSLCGGAGKGGTIMEYDPGGRSRPYVPAGSGASSADIMRGIRGDMSVVRVTTSGMQIWQARRHDA